MFPIADCREGYNTGLTTGPGGQVNVSTLKVEAPISIGNVAAHQKWCIITEKDKCGCPQQARGHVQTRESGKIVNINGVDGCKFLQAMAMPNGKVTWTVSFQIWFMGTH